MKSILDFLSSIFKTTAIFIGGLILAVLILMIVLIVCIF